MWTCSRRRRDRQPRQHFPKPLNLEQLESRQVLSTTVIISEFLAQNRGGLRDGSGSTPDWIEIYNASQAAVDLTGYHLTDDANDHSRWSFPSVNLGAGDHLVVFASGQPVSDFVDADGNLHTNFSLKRSGEYLALVAPDGTVLSEYGSSSSNYPEQRENVSYGVAQSLTLLDSNSAAAYWVPLNDSLGLQWTLPEFDAAANGFVDATASIGFDSMPTVRVNLLDQIQTVLPDRTHAVLARMEFQLDEASAVTDLLLRLKYDNGFVAYLNGVPVAQDNVPGDLQWFSMAPDDSRRDSEAIEFVDFDISEHVDALRDGTNVLAIHGLNHPNDRTDMLLVPELFAGVSDMRAAVGTDARVGYMPTPTPGRPNVGNEEVFSGIVADTKFSVDHGFFESPQQVEISTDTSAAVIRYTTDGSAPTTDHGALYTGPIPVTATTTLRAAAFTPGWIPSNVDTQSYIFLDDVIMQPSSPPGWPTDSASWGRFTPDYEMDPDVVGPYRATIKDDLATIPSISIVMDMEDLFGSAGIMRNPQGQGDQWERLASVELINPDGTQGFQINGVIRVAGSSWARNNIAKRGFRVLFKDVYGPNKLPTGGSTSLEYPLFSDTDVQRFDSIVLKGRADHSYLYTDGIRAQYIREHWSRDTMRDMGHVTTHGTYAHVYLNGLYWGLYAPFERPDGDFQARYQGGEPDQWYTRNGSSGWKGPLGADPLWNEMLASRDYDTIAQYLDVDNFIDYMMVNFYAGNVDWPDHNWWAARKNEPGAKFQFFQNDTEMSFYGPQETHMDNLGGELGRLYQLLLQFPQFRLRFADRVQKHLFNDGALTPAAATARWMARSEQIDRAIVGESARWGDNRRATPYTRDVEWVAERDRLLNQFFPTRTDFMVDQFRRRGLYTSIDAPSFNQHGGIVSSTFDVRLDAPDGTIYYTADGSDPRLADGTISSNATEFTGPWMLNSDRTIKSRVLLNGEWSALSEASFYLASELPLRVTEINYNPHAANPVPGLGEANVGNDQFEFVELVNGGDQTINLGGVQFVQERVNGDEQGIEFAFAPQLLEPHERVVVVRNLEAFQSRYGDAVRIAAGDDAAGGKPGEYGGKLANRGEQITLIDANGRIVQQFSFGVEGPWPDRANGKGSSLEIIDAEGNLNDPGNWQSSGEFGGSPGVAGSPTYRPIVINEILAQTRLPQGDMVELHNMMANDVNITGWYLSDSEDDYFKSRIARPTTVSRLGYEVLTEADFGFDLDGLRGDTLWLVEADASGRPRRFVDHVQFDASPDGTSLGPWPTPDDRWVALSQPTFGQPNTGPLISDVVISEIHYSPVDPDGDGRLKADDFQFVEVYNRTAGPMDVTGWQLAGDVNFAFPAGTVIGAEQPLVVVAFDPANSTKANVFRFSTGMNPAAVLQGPFEPTLDTRQGLVQLVRPAEPPYDPLDFTPLLLADEVRYRSEPPWPSSAAGSGDSLSRTRPDEYGGFPTTWTAGVPTPGLMNVNLRQPGDANEDGTFDRLDLESILQSARYLSREPASWLQGDWTGDGMFNQRDIVAALQTNNYVDAMFAEFPG